MSATRKLSYWKLDPDPVIASEHQFDCQFYDTEAELNRKQGMLVLCTQDDITKPKKLNYAGLVKCEQTPPYAVIDKRGSHVRVQKGSTVYAVAKAGRVVAAPTVLEIESSETADTGKVVEVAPEYSTNGVHNLQISLRSVDYSIEVWTLEVDYNSNGYNAESGLYWGELIHEKKSSKFYVWEDPDTQMSDLDLPAGKYLVRAQHGLGYDWFGKLAITWADAPASDF